MDENFNAEKIIILIPIISLGTSIFNYIVNTIRNKDFEFRFKEIMYFIGGSIIYSISLGVFSYYFYKIIINKFYNSFKSYFVKNIY